MRQEYVSDVQWIDVCTIYSLESESISFSLVPSNLLEILEVLEITEMVEILVKPLPEI